MTEKNMQTLFSQYVKTHVPSISEVYELKISKGSSLPFNALKSHQEEALLHADSMKGLYHKITDQPWGDNIKFRFTSKKPFDCFVLVGVRAFVVLWFYHPNQQKVFIKIPIKIFIQEREMSTRKSLTEERAHQLGTSMYI